MAPSGALTAATGMRSMAMCAFLFSAALGMMCAHDSNTACQLRTWLTELFECLLALIHSGSNSYAGQFKAWWTESKPYSRLSLKRVIVTRMSCRFEAHQRLGLETIKCRVRKATPQTLKMHMI